MNIWKTKEEFEAEALAFNPNITDNIKDDPDYCIRGTVYDPTTNLYAWYDYAALERKMDLAKFVDTHKGKTGNTIYDKYVEALNLGVANVYGWVAIQLGIPRSEVKLKVFAFAYGAKNETNERI